MTAPNWTPSRASSAALQQRRQQLLLRSARCRLQLGAQVRAVCAPLQWLEALPAWLSGGRAVRRIWRWLFRSRAGRSGRA